MKHKIMSVFLLISCGCLLLVAGFLLIRALDVTGRLPSVGVFRLFDRMREQQEQREDQLTQIPLEDAVYPNADNMAETDPNELYYLYDFLYIGDSFIARLEDSGIIHESCTVLAKSGTSAKDWYVQDDNDRYVAFLKELQSLHGTPYRGIILYYGINYIKSGKNIVYMKQLIEDIQSVFPDVPLFVLKIMPVAEQFVILREGEVCYTSEEVNREGKSCVVSYNAELETYCRQRKNVIFRDTTEGFIDETGNMGKEREDERGLHSSEN